MSVSEMLWTKYYTAKCEENVKLFHYLLYHYLWLNRGLPLSETY